ncbi:MAG: hypothetical protein BroJett031_22850 [Betaproteobacteria bacterium]|nr:MAG: hypothetical protein BroJett031_22850 [Betaproteobacteria bacterium]
MIVRSGTGDPTSENATSTANVFPLEGGCGARSHGNGAASAGAVLTAALWVNEVDPWTAAALVLLPAAAALVSRFTRPAA